MFLLLTPKFSNALPNAAWKGIFIRLVGWLCLAIVLEHEKLTEQTLYGHLSEIFVQPGEWVE